MTDRADILVFDVNETLLDITHLDPLFARLFGDAQARHLWFAEMVLYSNAITLAGDYAPFGSLGAGALRMLGEIRGVDVTGADLAELKERMTTMPACPDVTPALIRLRDAGVRMVTLTNSAPSGSPTPMERAGIAELFESHHNVDPVRAFKPAPATYRIVTEALDVSPARLCLVAAHLWDTLGMQAMGGEGAFITRPGNALLPSEGVRTPTWTARDLEDFADQWLAARN